MNTQDRQFRRAMNTLGAAYRAGMRRIVFVRVLWIALAAGLALVALDALLALPAWLRGAIALGALPALAATALAVYRRLTAARSYERMIARELERAHPELDNTLVNAIDFAPRLAESAPATFASELMREEVGEAAGVSAKPELVARLRRADLRPDLRILGGCAALALLSLALWPVYLAVLPRFLDPAGDHPPFHPTRLRVDPPGATVQYGDSLNVTVRSSGPRPRGLQLVLESPAGERLAALPLYESQPGEHLQTIERVTADLVYYASMERGRSRRHRLTVARAPRLDTVRIRYEYPPYTRLRADTRFLPEPLIRAYPGTTATLLLTANRPISGGIFTLDGVTNALAVEEDGVTASAAFAIAKAASFEALLVDSEGTPAPEPYRGRIELLRDQPPEVTAVSPGTDSFATPDARVPVNIEARDDLGIRRIEIVRNLNDSRDYRRTVFEHAGGLTFGNVSETFDFADLGVRPGDVVDYYVSATDTDPAQPHTAATRPFRLMIISADQYRDLMQAQQTAEDLRQKYDEWAARLRELAEEQKRLAEDVAKLREQAAKGELDATGLARLADLEARQAALAEETTKLAEQLAAEAETHAVYDVEEDFKKRLKKFAAGLQEGAALMREGAQALDEGGNAADAARRAGALDRAAQRQRAALAKLGESADDYEQSVGQASRDIEQTFALYEDVEQFKYLLERQKNLERQARSLADVREPDLDQRVRLKELAEEQESIREGLIDLGRALREHAGVAKENFPKVAQDALDIADRMEELAIAADMAHAAESLQKFQGRSGHLSAASAYASMQSMVSQCNGAGGQQACEQRLRIAMDMALGRTFEQLAQGISYGEGRGGQGGIGQGRAGRGGGIQAAYNLYGNSEHEANKRSAGPGRRPRDLPAEPGAASTLATDTEEVAIGKDLERKAEGRSEEGPLAEYDRLVNEYFRRMAEP